MTAPLLVVRDVTKTYQLPRRALFEAAPKRTALDGVNLELGRREIVGIVGESGSGKSTLARLVVALEKPDKGLIERADGCRMQMIFQDPYGSLDPRQRIETIVTEPLYRLRLSRNQQRHRAVRVLEDVGITSQALQRYPHQFSGGQRQRIAIARALISEPHLLCADEPVSALDVSIQAQILNLLLDICAKRQLAMIFISHDLSVVAHMCDRVAVLKQGQIVEAGTTKQVMSEPKHSYSKQMRQAILPPDPVRGRALLQR